MHYVTQLVYVRAGHEAMFAEFEDHVLPLLTKYRGELLLRLRPDRGAHIAGSLDAPYEVHVVRFASRADLDAYAADEERRRWLHLKEQAVERTIMIEGSGP